MSATHATEAAATAGIVITVTGSFAGLQFDSMMVGFVGALVAQTLVPDAQDSHLSALRRYVWTAAQLIAAGLLAGILTPLAESMIASLMPSQVAPHALHMATAGVIGMVAPVVVPALRKLAQKIAERP